ncbi:hypothetical protein Salat_2438800 [Sesamum alatum]|uniref:Uncharacterized protein n=1 Tax=Sesamum alatum TaxID=300844 RepID=A0AAE2CFJ0_9LAMI|nr:hypothetical protein Salat_2438800 [Sesamum alatum]
MDVTPTDLKPPAIKRMPGRPKKSRRKEPGDVAGAVRRANVLKCKICNDNGHNRSTCPNKDEPIPVSASQPLPRACSQAEVAQKRPATKKSKPAPKPAPTAFATHTLRTVASSQPLPSQLLLPPSLFRSIGAPSNI